MTPPDSSNGIDSRDAAGTRRPKKESERGKVAGWPGYVRGGIFVIEKKIHGRKFHISTRATTLRGAMAQLARFEADPAGYSPHDGGDHDALVLDEAMVDAFHAWHLPTVSRQWALNVRSLLVDWANHLRGADLRRLSLVEHLKPHLRGKGQAHHRAKAIKLLFGWLRTERGDITRAQDVTLDLLIPTIKPAQQTGAAKAVPWERVVAVAHHLPPHVRDVLELLAATGWHVNEARRFAESGTLRERLASDPPDVVAVIGTRQKSGRTHHTALQHQHHVEVARRVRERARVIDNNRLRKHMLRAAAAAGVEPFQLGQLRHSVSTWLRMAGVADTDTAEFLGHESASTTRRHYIDQQVAPRVLPRAALRVVS